MAGDVVDLAMWNIIEAHATVLCASLIASKPVVMALIPDKLLASINSFYKRSVSKGQKGDLAANGHISGPLNSQSHLPTHRASYELQKGPVSLGGGDGAM